jgi:hypothetical protein
MYKSRARFTTSLTRNGVDFLYAKFKRHALCLEDVIIIKKIRLDLEKLYIQQRKYAQ